MGTRMFGVGGFQTPCNSFSPLITAPYNLTALSLSFPYKNYNTSNVFLYSNACSNNLFVPGRTGLAVFGLKKRRKSKNSILEVEEEDDVVDNEEEVEEEEDARFVPFENMKIWLQNKPTGFGEGKEYDTSIEDKLFEEMQQSRTAQLANINKLKNSPPMLNSKKGQQVQKDSQAIPSGIRVRVENLPKKRNIHRDLKQALKEFPGIVNIMPAVSGNKKTRDPVCKGFAFVDLKSEEYANRFVQTYSKQSISFGKIQKRITCEITKPGGSSGSASEQSLGNTNPSTSQPTVLIMDEDPNANTWETTSSDGSADPDNEPIPANWVEIREKLELVHVLEPNEDESTRPRTVATNTSLSSKQKGQAKRKKQVKIKSTNTPKLKISGSANRLKIKDKVVLTGVLSKYGAKATSALPKES